MPALTIHRPSLREQFLAHDSRIIPMPSTATTLAWIPSAQELPDDEATVLIAMDDQEVWTGFTEGGVWHYVSGERVSGKVTHWADFPPPPSA